MEFEWREGCLCLKLDVNENCDLLGWLWQVVEQGCCVEKESISSCGCVPRCRGFSSDLGLQSGVSVVGNLDGCSKRYVLHSLPPICLFLLWLEDGEVVANSFDQQ